MVSIIMQNENSPFWRYAPFGDVMACRRCSKNTNIWIIHASFDKNKDFVAIGIIQNMFYDINKLISGVQCT